jgi:predicted transposase YdaD
MSSASEPSSPHDALFYRTFSQPENAASELKHVLREELAKRIDWSSLKLASTRFVVNPISGLF